MLEKNNQNKLKNVLTLYFKTLVGSTSKNEL